MKNQKTPGGAFALTAVRRLFLCSFLSIMAAGLWSGPAVADANAALEWNAIATEAFLPTQGTDPVNQSRAYAMLHAAIHDALNSIEQRYEFYTPMFLMPNASTDAAVAAAAHDVLVALIPAQQALIDAEYASALAAIPQGPAKANGVLVGQTAAALTLARRANDGAAEAFATPYLPTGVPGDYTFTPPFDAPPFGPFAFAPGWGAVTPFGIDLRRHRLPGPLSIRSVAYAFDLAFVKEIGEVNSTVRTEEQSQIARFWYEDSPIGWNRIANTVLGEQNVELWKSARILALVNFAMADGFIAGFEAKYDFRFWRPVTAIRAAASDGNRFTSPDEDWSSYLITPPVPDYPSTHTVLGAAAAHVLIHFFGDRIRYSTTSVTEPGVTRDFRGFSQPALENGMSRVYAGIHFVDAVADGYHQGAGIGRKVAHLLPARHY
jgi:membrane-associated phospholipid phosphatase